MGRATSAARVVVLGGGRSGKAAEALLRMEGAEVTVLDGDVPFPQGDFDLCVTSPGIPLDHQWQRAARERGVKVVSELQLGAERWRARGGGMGRRRGELVPDGDHGSAA